MDVKKNPPSQQQVRSVLIPQKTTIRFDDTSGSLAESKLKSAHLGARKPNTHTNVRPNPTTVTSTSSINNKAGTSRSRASSATTGADALSGLTLPVDEHEEELAITEQSVVLTTEADDEDDFGVVSSSNVEIFLSDAIMDAFMQNSPSAASISINPLSNNNHNKANTGGSNNAQPQQQMNQQAKLRVVEEMQRIHKRAFVTEQQRQQLMQTALAMDAPRLARRIIQEEKEEREARARDLLLAAEAAQTAAQQAANAGVTASYGNSGNVSSGNSTPSSVLGSGSVSKSKQQQHSGTIGNSNSLSFLTGGELIVPEDEEDNNNNNDDVAAANKLVRAISNMSTFNSNNKNTNNNNNNTATTATGGSNTARRQSEEDERFCKAFDEVERIRKRIIQRASLPLYEEQQLQQIVPQVPPHQPLHAHSGSGEISNTRSNSGNGSSVGGGAGSGGTGSKSNSRRNSNSNMYIDTTLPAEDGSQSQSQLAQQLQQQPLQLQLQVPPPAAVSNSDYPMLSPGKASSPLKHLQQQKQQKQLKLKRQTSVGSTGSAASNTSAAAAAVDVVSNVNHLDADVYRIVPSSSSGSGSGSNSSSGGNSPIYPTTNGGGIVVKSIRPVTPVNSVVIAGGGAASNSTVVPPLMLLRRNSSGESASAAAAGGSTTATATGAGATVGGYISGSSVTSSGEYTTSTITTTTTAGAGLSTINANVNHAEQVTNSIDMLIGSRFNSFNNNINGNDADGSALNPSILSSSLVLLQQQLDSHHHGASSSSYRNVFSSHNLVNNNNFGGGTGPVVLASPVGVNVNMNANVVNNVNNARSSKVFSAGAATALANLSRPGSAKRLALAAVVKSQAAAPTGVAVNRSGSSQLSSGVSSLFDLEPPEYEHEEANNWKQLGSGSDDAYDHPLRRGGGAQQGARSDNYNNNNYNGSNSKALLTNESTSSLGSGMFAFNATGTEERRRCYFAVCIVLLYCLLLIFCISILFLRRCNNVHNPTTI